MNMSKKTICVLLFTLFSFAVGFAQYARTVLTETEAQEISQSLEKANQEKMDALFQEDEQKNLKKQVIKEMIDGWHNIVLVNGAFSNLPNHSFGLTYARVSKVGFYVNAMTNFNYRFSGDYTCSYDGQVDSSKGYYEGYPYYNGNKEYTHFSASAGIVVCLGIPLYAYAGAGYSYQGVFCETTDGKWSRYEDNGHMANVELGLIGQYKGVSLSVGFMCNMNLYVGGDWYAKIGVGYCFKDIKKK
jgi:hypothetical protein